MYKSRSYNILKSNINNINKPKMHLTEYTDKAKKLNRICSNLNVHGLGLSGNQPQSDTGLRPAYNKNIKNIFVLLYATGTPQ